MYQLVIYLSPVITLPYLFRIFNSDIYGYISFIIVYFAYFTRIVEYSFNIYSVRDISTSENSRSVIFSKVLILKLVLFLLSLLILIITYLIFFKSKIDLLSFLLSTGTLFAFTITPYWFYRGMEEMRYISVFNTLNKGMMLILIFLFIREKNDFILYFIIDFSTNLITAIFVLCHILLKYRINFIFYPVKDLFDYFKKGFNIFITDFLAFIYSSSNIMILGIFADSITLGYYAVSEKIINLLKGIFSPFIQAAFPSLSKLAVGNPEKTRAYIKNSSFVLGSAGFTVTLILFLFPEIIAQLATGGQNNITVYSLKMMSVILFSFSLVLVFSNLYLHSFGYFKIWSKMIMFVFTSTTMILILLLIMFDNYLSVVIYMTLYSELSLTVISIIYFLKGKPALNEKV
ncbi:MAG: oligosaccharide flippase family protein [Ignavibacteria bacterium]|nr:oligosaccharide flippase family protein [Ignavibacteria bacterium]